MALLVSEIDYARGLGEAGLAREQAECRARSESARREHSAAMTAEREKAQAATQVCAAELSVQKHAVAACEARRTRFFSSPYFSFIAGSVVTGGLCAAVVAASR